MASGLAGELVGLQGAPALSPSRAAINTEAAKVSEYAAFDVLRFILASAVMLSHIGALSWANTGNLAVQVFFALSGWLIGGILYKTSASELSRFYYNRATRIWIPYSATVAALYLTSLLHEPVRSVRWHEFLVYDLTFTHNWFTLWPDAQTALQQMPLQGTGNHFWSLAVEEQFYLGVPLLMTLLPFGRKVLFWVLVVVTLTIFQRAYLSVALGVLCAVLANTYPNWQLRTAARALLLPVGLGCAAVMALAPAAYEFSAPLFAASLILLCAVPLARTRVTQWIGGISFPLYLNAWIGIFVFHAIEKHFGLRDTWYLTGVEFLFGVLAAAVSYQLVDRVVMTHRSRYYKAHIGWALGAAAYLLVITGVLYAAHLRLHG